MTTEQLAYEIAMGIINLGVEGSYDSVSCSSAGDYPSIGVSQWEGERANALLESIPDGVYYAYRTYSEIKNDPFDMAGLKLKLASPEGINAQIETLKNDCIKYVEELYEVKTLDDSKCMIYAGIWCPTSTYVVKRFLQKREKRGFDLRSLSIVDNLFYNEYCDAAGVGERYRIGYENRAISTFNYVNAIDLSRYGE